MVESTLTRVWQHAKSNKAVAMMTAYRNSNEATKEENKEKNHQLMQLVRDAGYGYFLLDGYYIENKGKPNEVKVKERSLFIIGSEKDNGNLLGFIRKMLKKFNQESAIYKKDGQTDIAIVFQNGSSESLGKFSPNKIGANYSKMRGNRTFIFESAHSHGNLFAHIARYYTERIVLVVDKIDNHIGKPYFSI